MHLQKLQIKNAIDHPRELKCYGDKDLAREKGFIEEVAQVLEKKVGNRHVEIGVGFRLGN